MLILSNEKEGNSGRRGVKIKRRLKAPLSNELKSFIITSN